MDKLKWPDTLPGEEWAPALSLGDDYLISSLGRVARRIRRNNARLTSKTKGRVPIGTVVGYRFLKGIDNGSGYLSIGWPKKKYIHILVAEAFVPNMFNLPFVDHINTNPKDNRACNLRWVTPKENLYNPISRKRSLATARTRRIPVVQIDTVSGRIIREWPMVNAAAEGIGTAGIHISQACSSYAIGKPSTVLGFGFAYKKDYDKGRNHIAFYNLSKETIIEYKDGKIYRVFASLQRASEYIGCKSGAIESFYRRGSVNKWPKKATAKCERVARLKDLTEEELDYIKKNIKQLFIF